MNGDCINYNCDELPDHEPFGTECAPPRQAGFSAIVLVLCGTDITDPSDGTEVNTAITNGNAKLVEVISAGLDSAEPVLSNVAATPCRAFQTLYVNYNGSITDLSWTQNTMEFWTTLIEGYTAAAVILRQCAQDGYPDQSVWIDGEVTFSGSPINTKDGTDTARFEITFTTRKKPEIITTPAGVFA